MQTGHDLGAHPSADDGSHLPVGHPARPAIGRAVLASMGAGVVFVAAAWTMKELPALYAHEPWQDDPYDAFVSFAIFYVPLLFGLCAVRVPLCRSDDRLPQRRALDLLRASRVLLAVIAVTLASEWVSVALHAQRGAWTHTTTALICITGILSAVTIGAAEALRRARRQPIWRSHTPAQPDWLADALALAQREADRLGCRRDDVVGMLRWIERRLVEPTRRHPVRVSAALAAAFGALVAGTQAITEGYAARAALVVLAVAASGMFAFLVIVGAHLGLAGPASESRARKRAGR